jgi:hypothetical protein
MSTVSKALLLPLTAATHRLLCAGYMTHYDMTAHLFAFDPDGKHIASVPVVDGKVCGNTVAALEVRAK